jgi:predicted DNA binding CopG/RHH family protein
VPKLNEEEKQILESYERDEWKSLENARTESQRYQKYAGSTFQKDRRVNIRVSTKDLEGIQKKAIEEGIPYQTLISSILHKYLSGRLIEKNP